MTSDAVSEGESGQGRWRGRPVLSALVSAAVFAVPIAVSIASATLAAHLLPRPHGLGWTLGWWAVVLGVPTGVLVLTERLARRALPLAVLLKMTMVFPDRAPRRMAVAKRAGTTRDLARRVEEARSHGLADEPVMAAEKILALAGALNAHDRLTRGHGERVRAYTDLIADELDLPASDRDRLRWSALLHDIGKLAVHPHILNKPDKLDDAEWEVIRNHPLEGARLTAPLAGWLGEWANTIAEHHEKFDGTGYPHGLAGTDISLGGRIVAVADCYDTMTAIRTYKRPMSPQAARAELAACAGSHFDPRVVRAFLDVSLGRLRPVAGPLSWLGSLPFVSNVPRLGQAVGSLGRVGAAAATVTGVVAVGALHARPDTLRPGVEGARTVGASGTQLVTPTTATGRSPGADHSTKERSPSGTTTGGHSQGGGAEAGSPGSSGVGAGSTGNVSSGQNPSAPGQSGSSTGSPATTVGVGQTIVTSTTTTSPATTTTTGPPPPPSSMTVRNGGAQPGRPQLGDQIIITYSSAPAPSAICSAWSPSSYPDLVSSNVVVNGLHGSGDDKVTVTDSVDCGGGIHFGTVDLGQSGYFSGSATFGGANAQCGGSTTTGCSRVHWDGHHTLTITLGKESSGQPTQGKASVAVYTPDSALGVAGTISSPSEVQF